MEVGELMRREIVSVRPLFKWSIDVDSFDGKAIGDLLLSPIFYTRDSSRVKHKWQLELYPKGNTEDANGYLSVFLNYLSDDYTTVTFNLSLLSNTDKFKQKNVKKFEDYSFDYADESYGENKFISEKSVRDPEKSYLKNNKITILCEIIYDEINVTEQNSEIYEKSLYRLQHFDKFEKLLENREISDVTVKCNGKSFYLHKSVLTTSSSVFDAMFKNDMKEKNQNIVEVKDVKPEILEQFFRFMYTGKVNEIEKSNSELLIAAERYCVENLKSLCEESIIKSLSEENVFEYFNLADMNNAKTLKQETINFMSLHLEEFVKNQEFEKFGIQHPQVLFEVIKKKF